MPRLFLAMRLFFRVLFDGAFAQRALALFAPIPEVAPPPTSPPQAAALRVPRGPARSDALTLLAALQREARFVDFIQEPISEFPDAQIGSVVREIHKDCRQVLERMFHLRPVVAAAEGGPIEAPADADRFRLVGNVTGQPPFRGRLVHHGWEAQTCELPAWVGGESAARVVAPAEVELA